MITVSLHYWPSGFLQRLLLWRAAPWQRWRPAVLERHLPQSWNELTPRQLRSLAKSHFLIKSEAAKQLYLCYRFLNIPFWLFLRLQRSDVLHLYEHLSKLLGDNNLSRTLLTRVRSGLEHWIGPDHYGKNMSFLEFIRADTAYTSFLQGGEFIHLNTLAAVLYRPSRTDVFISAPDFNGDERIPLNEYHLAERVRQASRIPLVDRYAILLQYAGLRHYLQERYPETFSGGKPSRHGWAGVIVSLAGEKFGDDDAVASKNIHAIFTHLEMTLEELHQHA